MHPGGGDSSVTVLAMNSKQIKDGQLQVWWIPQVPMSPFTVYVNSPAEGRLLVDALAAYDLFQLNNNIKPDYCNAGGLRVWRDGAWEEWEDDDGNDVWNIEANPNAGIQQPFPKGRYT